MQDGLDRERINLKIVDEESRNDRETQKKLPGSTAKSASQPDGGRHFEKENAAPVFRRYYNCPVSIR